MNTTRKGLKRPLKWHQGDQILLNSKEVTAFLSSEILNKFVPKNIRLWGEVFVIKNTKLLTNLAVTFLLFKITLWNFQVW